MVDVAGEDDDRGRRLAALAGGDLAQEVAQLREGLAEGGPVVEVDFAPQLLARPGGRLAPGAVAELLVPGLEPVEGGGEEPGDGGADQQVVEVARSRARRSSPTPRRRRSPAGPPPAPAPARESMKIARVRPKSRQKLQRVPAPSRLDPVRPGEELLLGRSGCRAPAGRGRPRRARAARGCRGAGRSSSWRCSRRRAGATRTSACISSSQPREMFQSSLMSWSSQSIETETQEKSQRISGSSQLSS